MRFNLILMWCLILPVARSQEPPKTPAAIPETPYVEREEKQFPFFPGGKIGIEAGVPGNIKLVGWEKGSIRMEAEKIVYYLTPEEAKAKMAQFPIKVRWGQTSATIRTPTTPPPGATMEYNLTIYVPKERTDITLSKSQGDLTVELVNGGIEVMMTEGTLEAKSLSGYFSAKLQKGDIRVEMTHNRWKGFEFAAVTQLGSIELRLPLKYSAALQLDTRNGKIVVDYPPQIVEGEPEPPEIAVHKTAQSLKATLGDGGPPIKLATYSGNVKLSKITDDEGR
jgi:DUF4097 and DUF4098 domain-containing protein YvlB